MANTIHSLIRAQWRKRHSANTVVRGNAINLIRVHVDLLRRMREVAAAQETHHGSFDQAA